MILLIGSVLMIISVLANRISSSFGVPSLILFLGIGMLAGSEGPGGIAFNNYSLAYAVGSVCLALIIFDGGIRTSWKSVRSILPLGISLSFVGTMVTGASTGIFAHYVFGLTWLEGLLLGAIVSSTDAAAVFGILRAKNLSLKGSLKQTLEFEAGSNDPVAIFLTIGILTLMTTQEASLSTLPMLFVQQLGLGLAFGWFGGLGIKWLINNARIEFEGLYNVLLIGLVILLFASTALIGGSGFLAVYVAGVYLGNADLLQKVNMIRFQDGIAWIAQIIVFLTLGLLSYPSKLLEVWKVGIVLALFMMFVARPLSVIIAAPRSTLKLNQRMFVSWIGLRGAAPIILATLPWSMNIPNAEFYFNLVFFVVLVSVVIQGVSIPWIAEKLGVTEPMQEGPARELSTGLLPAGFITVEVKIRNDTPTENQRLIDIHLPEGVLLTSLEREGRYLIPKGNTILTHGDKIWALARPDDIESLTKIFGSVKKIT